MAREPRINDRYPIEKSLSPPVVGKPIPECSEAVYVSGFVPGATVRVFANGSELLAEVVCEFGFAEIPLQRPLKLGESVTATQTVENLTSTHSAWPVKVTALPTSAVKTDKPKSSGDIYQCGRIVPVDGLTPGVRVHVEDNGAEVGNEPTAATWHAVTTQPLTFPGNVRARQIACEGSGHEITGPWSDDAPVKAAPDPMPSPTVDPNTLIPGNDTVTVQQLLVGSAIEIKDGGALVSSGWLANGSGNLFPINPPLTGSSSITATQELCGRTSLPSAPVTPSGTLQAPTILGPICHGAQYVVVRDTTINANVVILRNGQTVGYAGAAPGDVVIALGSNIQLHAGDVVTALQYMGDTVSPTSHGVTVVGGIGEPAVELLGGEPFFLPKGEEEAIDGPVFPRGRGAVTIRVQACCTEEVKAELLDPDGTVITEVQLTDLAPGYFTGAWNWPNWPTDPNVIPVGRYAVRVTTGCDQRPVTVPFYVIFNPADVNGPSRFSFDDTAVWFASGVNSTKGLHYYLHPSDNRVFSRALNAVSGLTDSYDAAVAVARMEEGLFDYSLSYHTQDVVSMLTSFTEAQCADDACVLTAFMRAVGIPCHPVTVDAALETGAADWTFDTWVEFLAPHDGTTDWRILHPHQYPAMAPETRGQFGTTRDVATNSFNDYVIMAGENWVLAELDDGTNDVTCTRQACGQPGQNLTKAPWIVELCEAGYWSQTHWDCTAVRARSLRVDESLDLARADFGDQVEGVLRIVNTTREDHTTVVIVDLISHDSRSKAFVGARHGQLMAETVVPAEGLLELPIDFQLPRTLPPGHDLYVRAQADGRMLTLEPVPVTPRIDAFLDFPATWRVGEYFEARATVRNISGALVQDVIVSLDTPFALIVSGSEPGSSDSETLVRWAQLPAGEEREVRWTVRAIAPLQSGSAHLRVSTADGGGKLVPRPFRVTAPEIVDVRVGSKQ
ncbi:Transglutaminase-like superfamily protein [Streptomyces sp. 2231.1]|nr:Transglutaminase-like superfamily protein [Streptomyces sp. 2231.1]